MFILIASVAFARPQDQIATVTSSAKFQLRGAVITPGTGVPNWPVLAGDTIKSGTELTVVTFTDGSVLALNPGSVATVDLMADTPVFRLLSGSAAYSLKSATSVELLATDKKVNVVALTGSYSIGGAKQAGGFWTAGHTAAVVGGVAGVGGATAAALGFGSSNSAGPQVSPSR
jgi:hypothetical protein